MVRDFTLAHDLARAAKAALADLVEFRLDECFSGDEAAAGAEIAAIVGLVSGSALPCIVTCRPTGAEGGGYDGPDDARISLFERLGTAFGRRAGGESEHPPRYLDVELSTWQRSANIRQKVRLAVEHPEQVRDVSTSLILSSHDFIGRPADLSRRLAAMNEAAAARVHKIAFRARSVRDNLELFDVLAAAERPTIALGMGEFGLMSRILAPKFGGLLTFASLRKEEVTAPGQPTVAELVDLYRFRSISARTRVFGVIGWPIGHSLSPLVHNAGFAAVGFDGVYVPMPVPGEGDSGYANLKATLLEFIDHPRLSFCGASVTLPHKENLVRLAREMGWVMDETSRAIGAANTIVVERDTADRAIAVRVMNTDVGALVASVAGAVGGVEGLRGKRVAVLGAGGVARAAAWGLASAGATVVVYGRTKAKVEALVAELRATVGDGKIVAAEWGLLPRSCAEVYVNATPIGMAGGPAAGDSALSAQVLAGCSANKGGTVVMETVYNPVETPTLRAARDFGCRCVDGVSMFCSQAEAQFAVFTGSLAPAGLFDRLARERLAPTVLS